MHGDGSVFYTQPVIDIGIRKTGLASRLSNLVARQFELDGVVLASIEGGLQASKCEDPLAFYELASMSGYRAWKRGQDFNSWSRTRSRSCIGSEDRSAAIRWNTQTTSIGSMRHAIPSARNTETP